MTESPMTEPGGFVAQIERTARAEAERVLEDLVRLRFDAQQIDRVLKALSLPVPPEITALISGLAPAPTPRPGEPIGVDAEQARRVAEAEVKPPPPPPPPVEPPKAAPPVAPPVPSEAVKPPPAVVPPEGRKPDLPPPTSTSPIAVQARKDAILAVFTAKPGRAMKRKVADQQTGLSQTVVSRYVRDLMSEGLLIQEGYHYKASEKALRRADKAGEIAPPTTPEPPKAPKPVAPEAKPTLFQVRDLVTKARTPFTVAQIIEGHDGWDHEVARTRVHELVRQGIVEDSSLADLELFEYKKPTAEGAASRISREQKPTEDSVATESQAGGQVANGAAPRAGRKDVQEVLNAIVRNGHKVEKTGSGHFRVTPKGGGKQIIVSSTPSSSKTLTNERAMLRRAGVL